MRKGLEGMKIRITWRAQLIIFIEVTLCLLIGVIVWYINSYLFGRMLQSTEDNRLKTFQRMTEEISLCRDEMEDLANTIFINSKIHEFCSESYGMDAIGVVLRKDSLDYLSQLLRSNKLLHSILIRTSDGYELGAERNYTYNSSGAAWSDPGENGKWSLQKIPAHVPSQKDGTAVVSLPFVYTLEDKKVEIVMNLSEVQFRRLYSDLSEKDTPELFLCDPDGKIISSSGVELGTHFRAFNQQNPQDQQGGFVFDDRQIIYDAPPGLGLVIVEQIPLEELYREIDELQAILVWLLLGSFFCINLFLFFMMKKMLAPLRTLIDAMGMVQRGQVGYQIHEVYHNEFGDIIGNFNQMSGSISSLIERNHKSEEQKLFYALSALRAQINPHFLFNTINMIKWMAIALQADHIKSALDKLMILLRPLFKDNVDEVTLKEELEYTGNYIDLVNLRFGGNVELSVLLSPEQLQQKVPYFILQPIIENCVKHGFQQDYSQAKIEISCREGTDWLELSVQDNGKGISDEKIAAFEEKLDEAILQNGDRLGLRNVHMRIRLKYGAPYGLRIQKNASGGATVIVKLLRI